MNEKVIKLMDTAIEIKKALSHDEIRLEILEDYAGATISVNAINDLGKLYQMANGLQIRLVPVDNKIEIRLYIE